MFWTVGYLCAAALSGLLIYLAAPRQVLFSVTSSLRLAFGVFAALLLAVASCCAWLQLGFWAGFYATLTTLMLVLTGLPFFVVWWRKRYVG